MSAQLSATAALVVCLTASLRAQAEERVPAGPTWADAALLALDLGIIIGLKAAVPNAHRDGERDALNQVDGWAVEWGMHDAALVTSDVGVGGAAAWAALHSVSTGREHGAAAGIARALTYSESVLTTLAVAEVAKQAVQRPRPCTYQPVRRQDSGLGCGPAEDDAYLSFFSGHTASAAALSATATYWAVRGGSAARVAVTATAGAVLTTAVGVERVRAGKHFPTDVMTGAFVGAAVGVFTPWLRGDRKVTGGAATTSETPAALTLSGVF